MDARRVSGKVSSRSFSDHDLPAGFDPLVDKEMPATHSPECSFQRASSPHLLAEQESPECTARCVSTLEPPLVSDTSDAGAGLRESQAARAWARRLEHEVAELRTQVARRLDWAALDTAACRRDAEEAR